MDKLKDLPTCDSGDAPERLGGNKHSVALTLSNAICVQIDIKTFGGFLGLNFGAAGTLSLVKQSGDFNKVSFTGMLAGGVTAGVLVLKASFFVQGEAMISGSVPKAINQPMRALKWLLSSFWRGLHPIVLLWKQSEAHFVCCLQRKLEALRSAK